MFAIVVASAASRRRMSPAGWRSRRSPRRIGSMRRKTVYHAIEGIDRSQLEEFQAGMRKRYSDEHILAELNACAKRLGRSPTMREFEADPETTVHPQTVIEHFKSWNRAKRLA